MRAHLTRRLALGLALVASSRLEAGEPVAQCTKTGVQIQLSAPRMHLEGGEQTTLMIDVSGLLGQTAPLHVELRNASPDVVSIAGGDAETIALPSSPAPNGVFSTTRVLIGRQSGSFDITATVRTLDGRRCAARPLAPTPTDRATPIPNVARPSGPRPGTIHCPAPRPAPARLWLRGWFNWSRADSFTQAAPEGPGAAPSGYELRRIEGALLTATGEPPPDTVPLYSWYSPSRGDNFLGTDPPTSAAPGPDYRFVRLEGYAFQRPLKGTVPLYHWYSPARGDNLASSDPRWSERAGPLEEGYRLVGILGYVIAYDGPQPEPSWSVFGPNPPSLQRQLSHDRWHTAGERPLLVILMRYSDLDFTPAHVTTNADGTSNVSFYRRLVFGPDFPNVAGYYAENSVGRFRYRSAGVVGPFTFPDDPATPADESRRLCAGLVEPYCAGTSGDEAAARARAIGAAVARGGIDLATYDASRDDVVDDRELQVVIITPGPGGGGANRDVSVRPPGSTVTARLKVGTFEESASLSVVAHEIAHSFGPYALDLYGSGNNNYSYSLMGNSEGGPDGLGNDGRDTFHFEPWHKMAFGWLEPRVHDLAEPGGCLRLDAASTRPSTGMETVLFVAPARDLEEHFFVEYRTPSSAPGGMYDANVGSEGVAIWQGWLGLDGMPRRIPGLQIGAGPDGTLETRPNPRSDDTPIFRNGVPFIIFPGPNRLLETEPASTDVNLYEDRAMYLYKPPVGGRGEGPLWRNRDGDVLLRWVDRTPVGASLRIEDAAPGARSVWIEHLSTPTAPRIDGGARVIPPGGQLTVAGNFGLLRMPPRGTELGSPATTFDLPGGGGWEARLEGSGGNHALTATAWACDGVGLRVPAEVPPGEYLLRVVDIATPDLASNAVPVCIGQTD